MFVSTPHFWILFFTAYLAPTVLSYVTCYHSSVTHPVLDYSYYHKHHRVNDPVPLLERRFFPSRSTSLWLTRSTNREGENSENEEEKEFDEVTCGNLISSVKQSALLSSATLTIILPAYNEELRIENTIAEYAAYLKTSKIWGRDGGKWCDILVVDDGSEDGTCDVIRRCASDPDLGITVRSISLAANEGKGSAVSRGLASIDSMNNSMVNQKKCRSSDDDGDDSQQIIENIVLVADADGSGDIGSLNAMVDKLLELIIITTDTDTDKDTNKDTDKDMNKDKDAANNDENLREFSWGKKKAMLVGNRAGNTSLSRIVTRWGFQTTVKLFCGGSLQVEDTQCGFKLMTLETGLLLYSNLNLKRWTHDVEVLYRAKELAIPVTEMKIGWVDKEGSKLASTALDVVKISIIMLLEVLFMRINYIIGRWKVPDNQ